jgi:hypothetical protein
LSRDRATTDGVLISNSIYCTLVQLVTTINYRVNSRVLFLTMAHAKTSMSSLGVAWQRIPTMSSDSGFKSSQAGDHLTPTAEHWLQLVLPSAVYSWAELTNCRLSTHSNCLTIAIGPRDGPHGKHRSHQYLYCCDHVTGVFA